jgi:hypothetical protein
MGNAFSDLGKGFGAAQMNQPIDSSTGAPVTAQAPHANASTPQGAAPAAAAPPTTMLASGVGQILLFPGKTIVSQFVGAGDPLDASHLPITVLLSAAAWYAAYWYFFQRGGAKHQ